MEEQKNTSFFRFEDWRVYNKSLEYYNWLTNQVKQSDDFAKKALLMPMLDSAAKVSLNIAEGTSYHKSQFVVYLKGAKTNVRECVVFTTMALQNGYFSEQQAEISRTTLIEMTKMLGAMIASLQRSLQKKDSFTQESKQTVQDVQPEQDTVDSDFNLEFNY